jgi:hypothetical protein
MDPSIARSTIKFTENSMDIYIKKRIFSALSITFCTLLFAFVEQADARSFRVDMFPNGNVNSCANCHVRPSGEAPERLSVKL